MPAVDHEFRKLINLVTVTETCFFRDPSQFRLLRHHILPALMTERKSGLHQLFSPKEKTLRIWSAGCSSGEEAYSIALTLWDMGLYLAYPDWTFEIVGTDLNTQVLQKASQGIYSARALRNVEGTWLKRYFERDGSNFRLNDEIRRCVQFEFGNLTQTPMPSSGLQDVVFCKNVAIYFRSDVTRQLVRGLFDTLASGGYLVLGHSESLWQMADGFDLVEHDRGYCYRKRAPSSTEPEAPAKRGRVPFSDNPDEKGTRPLFDARGVNGASDQYDLCLAAFRADDWAAVESSLVELIKSCPTFVPAHLLLGGVYAHRARYDEALAQAESVLRISDLEPRAHLLLGMIAGRQGRVDDALQSLRRALYLDDSLALAHFWLGNLYRDRGDLARACHEYENVVCAWERHTLELTEEFASDLSAEQLVQFCSDSLQRLRGMD
jgi:chemotaxis protein methyltransferase CheR